MSYHQSSDLANAKAKETRCIGSRAAQRIETIMKIINNIITDNIRINNPCIVQFKMHDTTKRQIVSNLMQCIINYNVTTPKTTASLNRKTKPTYKKLRAFWNHKKAEKLGDYLFSVILCFLFEHMTSIQLPNMILLFIDIFCKLLQETIKYPRTKSLPLICCACFIKQNKFKQFCLKFLEYFGDGIVYSSPPMTKTERINGKSQTKYVRDSGRATKQHALYLQCLIKLRKQLETSNNNRSMQPRIKRFQKWIVENRITNNTNINPMVMRNAMSAHSNQGTFTVNNNCNNFIFRTPRTMNNVCTQNITTPIMTAPMDVTESKNNGNYCCRIDCNQFGNVNVNYSQMHAQLFSTGMNSGMNSGMNKSNNNNRTNDNSSSDDGSVVCDNNVYDNNLPPKIDNCFGGSFFDGNIFENNFIAYDPLLDWNDEQQYGCNQSQYQQTYI